MAESAEGGNYLLDVGPKADGTIPEEVAGQICRIGNRYRKVKESFDGTEPASRLTRNRDVLLTRRGNVLYVHLFKEPETGSVILPPIDTLPRHATILNTGRNPEMDVQEFPRLFKDKPNRALRLKNLPVSSGNLTGTVIRLEFDGGSWRQ